MGLPPPAEFGDWVSNPRPDVRHQLESVWKGLWQRAKLNLELANLHLAEIKRNNLAETLLAPNAYRDALEAATAALTEYKRVLQVYTDLVVHGKVPREDSAAIGAQAE